MRLDSRDDLVSLVMYESLRYCPSKRSGRRAILHPSHLLLVSAFWTLCATRFNTHDKRPYMLHHVFSRHSSIHTAYWKRRNHSSFHPSATTRTCSRRYPESAPPIMRCIFYQYLQIYAVFLELSALVLGSASLLLSIPPVSLCLPRDTGLSFSSTYRNV